MWASESDEGDRGKEWMAVCVYAVALAQSPRSPYDPPQASHCFLRHFPGYVITFSFLFCSLQSARAIVVGCLLAWRWCVGSPRGTAERGERRRTLARWIRASMDRTGVRRRARAGGEPLAPRRQRRRRQRPRPRRARRAPPRGRHRSRTLLMVAIALSNSPRPLPLLSLKLAAR